MFILSKILLFLLNPLFWICLLLLWGWVTRRPNRKKWCFSVGIISLLFFSNPFIANRLLIAYQTPQQELTEKDRYPVGILLGGFVGFDASGKGVFNESSERFIQTMRLYKAGNIRKVLISGGSGTLLRQNYREADFTRETLVQLGIPDSDIFTERNSRNTYENALFTKKILDSLQYTGTSLLITSAWHMPRASAAFKKAGIITRPYACDFKNNSTTDPEDILIPSAWAMGKWALLLKEWMGMGVYKMTGKI